ncbi:MAG: carboxypeptidase M32 [Planctomycetes bacterium]|nr:carboxypeptidase M32 [Planctomycetota bacterium]
MREHPAFSRLIDEVQKVGRLDSALRLLGWDQETLMPAGAAAGRAAAIGELTEVVHRRSTSKELGETIAAAEAALPGVADPRAAALLREVKRAYDRKRKVPPELAEEIARTSSLALQAWKEARAKSEYRIFRPFLEKMFALRRREAEAIGGAADLYDVLLDEYEPGCRGRDIETYAAFVKPVLVSLLGEIEPRAARAKKNGFLTGHFEQEIQERFARRVITDLGFDFDRGRVDISTHPFCSGIGPPGDVRLTTRYSESEFTVSLFGLIHEAGHGLYEQGLDGDWCETPLGHAVSMGIHESQSRLWENIVGRGRAFWTYYLPVLEESYPEKLAGVGLDSFLRAINGVRASLIRVEADEVTYNLHILLRFELERALLSGTLPVADLPAAWNEKMKETVGIVPRRDAEGCLQDIHWSFGAIGYFPTYFLGNLYAAQLYEAAARAIPDLEGGIARGEFRPLRDWLGEQVHKRGAEYPAQELCRHVTGRALDPGVFARYLTEKMRRIHAA